MATEEKNASDLGQQAMALAEQLGHIAGTIEGTAEAWLNRQALADQLTRVRDGATKMLEALGAGRRAGKDRASRKKKTASGTATARTRRHDSAHAPGKQHRKPAPTLRGVKKSDQRIPKARTAAEVRRRRKSYA